MALRLRYAKEGSGVYVGLCAMLLCRCAQGEVLTVPEAKDTREAGQGGVQEWGINRNGWFIRENPIKMDDLREPPFMETPKCLGHKLVSHDARLNITDPRSHGHHVPIRIEKGVLCQHSSMAGHSRWL